MKVDELRKNYLDFFKSKEHKIISSSSLIPENDPTVLFTTAGMHPLVPFLLGQPHPSGKRLADCQKCVRTGDIESVGDSTHLTFFEMLGNWSLGDYFKKEAIGYSYEFMTEHLKLNSDNLYITCFEGDRDAPKDTESAKIWQSLGIKKEHIFFLSKKDNWWGPAGEVGPCGPCTEMFMDTKKQKCSANCSPGCSCGKYVEIWNDVFMEYNKEKDGAYVKLKQKNVDTGMGLERTSAILQGHRDMYGTESFKPLIKEIEKISKKKYGEEEGQTRAIRIIVDHLKAATFILAEKIAPSNLDRGYVLRRLIRRAVRYGKELGITENFTKQISGEAIKIYEKVYPELSQNKSFILTEMEKEENNFKSTLENGLKIAEKLFSKRTPITREKFIKLMQLEEKTQILKQLFKNKGGGKDYGVKDANISKKEIDNATVTGEEAFYLYQSFGFPIEMIIELVREKNLIVDKEEFQKELERHQELSRTATKGKFKSGLGGESNSTIKLHTATHLLLKSLQTILKDPKIEQRGSNINPERLRLDFNFERKLTDEEIRQVEDLVNQKIQEAIPVKREEMTLEQARKSGAHGTFAQKYGEKVSVYTIGSFSKEICAGPHAANTSELGHFKIKKQEAVSSGVRRIKAVLE